jgi:hypothetical protein
MAFLGYINRDFRHINVLGGYADFFVDADAHAHFFHNFTMQGFLWAFLAFKPTS